MTALARRIGLLGAVGIGLASMLGAGLFAVWGPAARASGDWLLVAVLLAGAVALLNALSVAALARRTPLSGGIYAYGRAELGRGWGLAAGWLFLAGKTCSAAAIALIVAGYAAPGADRAVAVVVLLTLAAVNLSGVRVTVAVSLSVVAVVIAGLLAVVLPALLTGGLTGEGGALAPAGVAEVSASASAAASAQGGASGIPAAAAVLFFAFAGYARMATLGEEVRDPWRTLPRAILVALGITVALYLLLGRALQQILGERLGSVDEPLRMLVSEPWVWVVVLLAAVAGLGSLLAILAGLSRTSFALARDGELPRALARVWSRTGGPAVAEVSVALLAAAGVLLLPTEALIGFSACTVLGYYAIGHAAALRIPASERRLPRVVPVLGLLACLGLVASLPWTAWVYTVAVLALASIVAAVLHRGSPAPSTPPQGL